MADAQRLAEVRKWVDQVFEVVKIHGAPATLRARYAEDLVSGRLQADAVQAEVLALAKCMGTWGTGSNAAGAAGGGATAAAAAASGGGGSEAPAAAAAGAAGGPVSPAKGGDVAAPTNSLEEEKERLRQQMGMGGGAGSPAGGTAVGGPAASAVSSGPGPSHGMDQDETKEWVNTLYEKATGKRPDPATFMHVVNNLMTGEFTVNQAELFIVHSKEAKAYREAKAAEDARRAALFAQQLDEFVRLLFKKYANNDTPSDAEVAEHVDALKDGSATFDSVEAHFKLMAL